LLTQASLKFFLAHSALLMIFFYGYDGRPSFPTRVGDHGVSKPERREPCGCAYLQYALCLDSPEQYRKEDASIGVNWLANGKDSCWIKMKAKS